MSHFMVSTPGSKSPKSKTEVYDTKLLQVYGVKYVDVLREVKDDRRNETKIDFPIEALMRVCFPHARPKSSSSKKEGAEATRLFFACGCPSRVVERVQAFMDKSGCSLIWTPSCMPNSQSIGLFWANGKSFVSLNFDQDRKLNEVYGNDDWPIQGRGWKSPKFEGFVRHAIQEMNAGLRSMMY